MDNNFEYFRNLRQQLLESAQITISYRWKRYVRLKKQRERDAANNLP